jgi:hypothetical protein
MYARPTPRQLLPDLQVVPEGTKLYKGISSNSRIYEKPVFFTFSKNHAQTYATARLGEYVTSKTLRLLKLSNRTIKFLLNQSDISQLNKNRISFITGVTQTAGTMSVGNQLKLVNRIVSNTGHQAHIKGIMEENIKKVGGSHYSQGGRKSFYDIDLLAYKSICAFCKKNGYDGYYAEELSSVYHPKFGSELVICNPREALVNVNFPIKNNKS